MPDNMPYDSNRIVSLKPAENGRNYGGEKEVIAEYKFVAPNPHFDKNSPYHKRYAVPVTVRVYMGRSSSASTVYATIWARSRDGKLHMSGTGSAGGGGYHKESAAINSAMVDAGIKFKRGFGGAGDGAAMVAIKTLAKRLGWKTGDVI